MRVLRMSLFVAATAIVAAACGDKVNVLGPGSGGTTTPTAKINGVLVAPNAATISVLQQVQLTAVVDADAGITATVAWSTTSSAAATVSQTGLVTGVTASPGVAICATASAAGVASKGNCATIVVQPATTTTQAVIQISSVTDGNPGGSLNHPVAVPPAVVAGQINVSVQLSPGTETVDSVYLMMNGKLAGVQKFTHTQSAALRSAANDAIASQSLLPTIVFSINTAAYATAGCGTAVPPGTPGSGTTAPVAPCGTPTWGNGTATLVAIVSGRQPGVSASTTQSAQAPAMLLGNTDAWLLNTTLAATTHGPVANGAGYNYVGGQTASVAVSAVPVIYTAGATIISGNVSYGTTACDASLGAQRTIPLVANTAPAIGFADTFPRAPQKAEKLVSGFGVDVNNYEFNATACPAQNAAGGEGAYIASSMYANTTNGLTGFALGFVPVVYRLDNRAPGAPTFESNPNARQNGWVNADVSFTGLWNVATAKDNMDVAGAADAGVGGYVLNARLGAVGAGGTVGAALLAQTAVVSPNVASPSPALLPSDQNAYCGVISATDKLGNESTLPTATTACAVAGTPSQVPVASQALQFGLDIAPPTIVWSAASMAAGSSGKNGRTGASVLGEYVFTVVDTGAHGNSGMQATSPVQAWVAIHTQAVGLTALQLCPVGTPDPVSGVCTASSVGFAAPVFPTVTTNTLTPKTIIGYYTISANAIDAAGNSSVTPTAQMPLGNTLTRTVAYNPAANVPSLSGSIFNTPLTGPTATFTATGSSGNTTANSATTFFDLWEAKFNLTYSAAVPGALLYPPSTPPFNIFNNTPAPGGSANITTFVAQNAAIGITIPFYRSIQNQTSACNAVLAIGATGIPNALNETLLDQVGNVSAVAVTGITAGQVTPGTSYLGAPAAQQVYTFLESNGISEAPVTGCPFAVGANTQAKVSGGGTSPDGASITLTADVFGPTATFLSPFASVNFYVFIGGNMELIGSTSTYAGADDGSTNGHKFTYSLSWTPGSKSPISATAWPVMSSAACAIGATNAQLYVLGISAVGDGLLTPVNQNICISTAP